jgi:hypothetical protein
MEPEICHLCERPAVLRSSHIIPSWAYRDELRGKGGAFVDLNEFYVHGHAIELKLLCDCCEQMFGNWETIAKQFGQQSEYESQYGDWLLKFATSISWRVLKYFQLRPEGELSETQKPILALPSVGRALACWSDFMRLGKLPATRQHRQHFFPVSPDYEMRKAIGLTISQADGNVFTYARFSFFCIVGLIESTAPKQLEANHIKVRGGDTPKFQNLTPKMAACLVALERDALARALAYAMKDDPSFASQVVTGQWPLPKGSEVDPA